MAPSGVGPEFIRTVVAEWFVVSTMLALMMSIAGLAIAKFFVRQVPIWRLWWACLFPLYALFLLFGAVLIVAAWFGFYIALATDLLLGALALGTALWLVVRDVTRLKHGAAKPSA